MKNFKSQFRHSNLAKSKTLNWLFHLIKQKLLLAPSQMIERSYHRAYLWWSLHAITGSMRTPVERMHTSAKHVHISDREFPVEHVLTSLAHVHIF